MQKVINVLAVLSFVGTAGIIGGGYYLYTQKDPIIEGCLLYTSPSPRDATLSRMPSSA